MRFPAEAHLFFDYFSDFDKFRGNYFSDFDKFRGDYFSYFDKFRHNYFSDFDKFVFLFVDIQMFGYICALVV